MACPSWDSDYDSTWEEDNEDGEPRNKKMKTSYQHNRWGRSAARDLQNYRHGYPDDSYKPNLQFYQNKIAFKPNGEYIDIMHDSWRYDYYTLETNHNFIQWLFPLREPGVNRQATPLTLSEIQMMKMDKQVMKRLLGSYKLMLGFYGLVLLDEDTGEVARAEDNWEERFDNLNNNTHNNLRITRILKCLGELGYEKFQAPLVKFFLEETLCNGELPKVKRSALDYFMFTVKDKKERQRLVHFAWMHYTPQDSFIWGPVDKLEHFNPMPEKSELICEDIEEPQVNLIPSKSVSSEGGCVVDIEVAGEEPERKSKGFCSLVRRALGYIMRPFWAFFRLLSRPFVAFFRLLYRPFRCFFTGCFFWFRGERRDQDRSNEEKSVRTEGDKAENPLLWPSPEQQESSHKEEGKELHGQSYRNVEKLEKGCKIETENVSKYESVPESDTEAEDGKFLGTIRVSQGRNDYNGAKDGKPTVIYKMSSEGREDDNGAEDWKPPVPVRLGSHTREDDKGAEDWRLPVTVRLPISSHGRLNDAEDEDNAANFTKSGWGENVINLDKDPTSVNTSFIDSKMEDHFMEKSNDSDERTKEGPTDKGDWDRTYIGAMKANGEEANVWVGETEDEEASNMELGEGPLPHGDEWVTEST